jgi:putative membrane protein
MQLTEHLHHEHEHNHDHEAHDEQGEMLRSWLKIAVLLGLGAYFIYNIASGNLSNYINVRFAWLSYVAAALFVLLGAFSAYNLLRSKAYDIPDPHKDEHHNHDHDHNHGISWLGLAVVSIPLLLGTLIPSRPLGADAIQGVNMSVVAVEEAPLSTNPSTWNVLDWLRSFNMNSDIHSFDGQAANIVGFVYRDANFAEDQFMVARFTISCCVADASAIGLPVVVDNAQDYETDSWVQVNGTFRVEDFRNSEVPVLYATSVEQVEEPEHPYLYP